MEDLFPLHKRLRRFAGILEAVHTEPLINEYVGLLEFDDGSVAELREDSVTRTSWAEAATDIPIQAPSDDTTIVGRTVTNVVLREPEDNIGRRGQAQLFLILDGEVLLGLVPTKLGTRLHTEPALTSPLITRHHQLVSLTGETLSLDDLVLS